MGCSLSLGIIVFGTMLLIPFTNYVQIEDSITFPLPLFAREMYFNIHPRLYSLFCYVQHVA